MGKEPHSEPYSASSSPKVTSAWWTKYPNPAQPQVRACNTVAREINAEAQTFFVRAVDCERFCMLAGEWAPGQRLPTVQKTLFSFYRECRRLFFTI